MYLVTLSKLTCWTALLACAYAADPENDTRSRGPPSNGRPPHNFAGGIRPRGRWISPEYKWFFEYPLPLSPAKSKTL